MVCVWDMHLGNSRGRVWVCVSGCVASRRAWVARAGHIWLLPFFAGSKCKSLFLQARACEVDGSSLMAGRPPSGSGDLLGPQPSSEVEQLEAPADRRPLRNVLRARPSSEVCWRCCGPCPARSHPKRTPARIAHLLPSMRHARASPSLIIPTWQACPPE